MKSRRFLTRISLLAVFLASSAAFAVDLPAGKDIKATLRVLIQARAAASWDGDTTRTTNPASPHGTVDTDFYIRRGRLIFEGLAYKYFTWYLLFDTPNFGIRGNYNVSTFTQDIHVGYKPADTVDIEAGFLYMPLSHLALNSSSGTSAIEKSTAILFYNRSTGLRETGVQVRALLLDRRILVRGGLYEGIHGYTGNDPPGGVVNPNGRPLVAGIVRYNLIGDEGGYAYPTMYLDGKTRASIGVGAQFQVKGSNTPITSSIPNAITGIRPVSNTAVNDYLALAGDVFADVPLPGDTEFTVQADVYRFDWGAGSDKTGYGTTLELAYRLGQIVPEVNGYWFNSESHQNSFLKVAGGLSYLFKGHQAKIGVEFWHIKSGVNFDASNAVHQVVAQAQAFF